MDASTALCGHCSAINLRELAAESPIRLTHCSKGECNKPGAEKYRHAIYPKLRRPRSQLVRGCPMCHLIRMCIEDIERQRQLTVTQFSLTVTLVREAPWWLTNGFPHAVFRASDIYRDYIRPGVFQVLLSPILNMPELKGLPAVPPFDHIFVQLEDVNAARTNFGTLPIQAGPSLSSWTKEEVFRRTRDHVLATDSTRITWIRHWLDTCRSSHPACRSGLSGVKHRDDDNRGSVLPRRIIDVGDATGSTDPRLVVTLPESHGTYVALSYVWGEQSDARRPLLLTKNNMDSLQDRIPSEALLRTVTDAIQLTRDLGIRYLWVDQLCILQDKDDRADWEDHAPKMCDIYERAVLTISALGIQTQWDSMLPPVATQPVVLPCGVGDHSAGIMYVRPLGSASGTLHEELRQSILSTRGWTLQESILSRRVIHIGRRGIYWECRSQRPEKRFDPEAPLDAAVTFGSRPRTFHYLERAKTQWLMQPAIRLNDGFGLGHLWSAIVDNYTTRRLTEESDRLPAIEGIVEAIKKNFAGVDFLYGICEPCLGMHLGGLMWQRHTNGTLTRPEVQRAFVIVLLAAPSWSWAAWNGRTIYRHFEGHHTMIQDAKFFNVNNGPGLAGEADEFAKSYLMFRTDIVPAAVYAHSDSEGNRVAQLALQLEPASANRMADELVLDDPQAPIVGTVKLFLMTRMKATATYRALVVEPVTWDAKAGQRKEEVYRRLGVAMFTLTGGVPIKRSCEVRGGQVYMI